MERLRKVHQKSQSGCAVSKFGFEPGIFCVYRKCANHLITMLGLVGVIYTLHCYYFENCHFFLWQSETESLGNWSVSTPFIAAPRCIRGIITDRGKSKYLEKISPQCHCVCYKSQMDCPVIEFRPL